MHWRGGLYIALNCIVLFSAASEIKDATFRSRSMPIKWIPASDIKAYNSNSKFNPKLDFKPTGTQSLPASAGVSLHQKVKAQSAGKSTPGEFPWHALLRIDETWLCGGSLISPDWILTAAHCVNGSTKVQIMLGRTKRSEDGGSAQHDSSQIIIHNHYFDFFLTNDIALVKMDTPALLDAKVNFVRLPAIRHATVKVPPVLYTVASGFGYDESRSDALNYVNMNLVKNSQCASFYGPQIVSGAVICAVTTAPDRPCGADSGGPLVMLEPDGLYTLIGVMSFGETKSCDKFPVAFTRVPSFLGWISHVTGIQIRK